MVEKAMAFIDRHKEDSFFSNHVADYILAFAQELQDQPNEISSDFQEFWDLYKLKRGKPKCLQYWSKLGNEDRRKAIDNVKKYRTYCMVTGRNILDPQGYLNPANRRFDDEYPCMDESREWAKELIDFFDKRWKPHFHPYESPELEAVTLDLYRLRCTFPDVKLNHIKGVAHYIIDSWAKVSNTDLKPYITPAAVLNAKKWGQRKVEAQIYFIKYQ